MNQRRHEHEPKAEHSPPPPLPPLAVRIVAAFFGATLAAVFAGWMGFVAVRVFNGFSSTFPG